MHSFSFLLVLLFLTSPTLTEPTEITWKQRCTDIDDDGTLGGLGQAMAFVQTSMRVPVDSAVGRCLLLLKSSLHRHALATVLKNQQQKTSKTISRETILKSGPTTNANQQPLRLSTVNHGETPKGEAISVKTRTQDKLSAESWWSWISRPRTTIALSLLCADVDALSTASLYIKWNCL